MQNKHKAHAKGSAIVNCTTFGITRYVSMIDSHRECERSGFRCLVLPVSPSHDLTDSRFILFCLFSFPPAPFALSPVGECTVFMMIREVKPTGPSSAQSASLPDLSGSTTLNFQGPVDDEEAASADSGASNENSSCAGLCGQQTSGSCSCASLCIEMGT